MAAWLSSPVTLHSSRMFECDSLNPEECSYYQQLWHFWYEADHVYGLSTIAFFMCAIGIFVIGHFISQVLGYSRSRGHPVWHKTVAGVRYLSYRGVHVKSLRWNSAPVGLLLLAGIGTAFFFCMDLIPQPYYWPDEKFGNSPPLGTRSGWMALACMPFVFATASKANWITLLTGVSHEKLQIFHRWISYAFFVLALMHTFPFIVYHIRFHDMVEQVTQSNTFEYWTGIVALVFQGWLTFASFGPIRNLGYEFFKAAHFLGVIVFIVVFFWHCGGTLTSWDYFIATAAVYVPSLVFPWIRTCFEYGIGQKAKVAVEVNGFTSITIPAKFHWVPGQHCFLRFPGFGVQAMTSHPFTICSLPSTSPSEGSEIAFYIRRQGGFTTKLYDRAFKHPGNQISVLVDGPYGGVDLQRLRASERLVVIAGGSGAGWTLPFIELFVRQSYLSGAAEHSQGGPAGVKEMSISEEHHSERLLTKPLSLRVVLATRDVSTRVWFLQAVREMLAKYPATHSASDLDIQVYLTGEAEPHADASMVQKSLEMSDSSMSSIEKTVKQSETEDEGLVSGRELSGRPHLPVIIRDEAAQAAETDQSMGVFVCGPTTMQNDVRNAVAEENLNILRGSKCREVYLHMEHFSWA